MRNSNIESKNESCEGCGEKLKSKGVVKEDYWIMRHHVDGNTICACGGCMSGYMNAYISETEIKKDVV